jgi:hypothetical protein
MGGLEMTGFCWRIREERGWGAGRRREEWRRGS